MKITKRQLRRIIRESVYGVGPGRGPSSVQEWTKWSETFGLDSEYDNEGQLHFYLDARSYSPRDFAAIVKEAERAGASVETDNYGQTIIYTGMTDMGAM